MSNIYDLDRAVLPTQRVVSNAENALKVLAETLASKADEGLVPSSIVKPLLIGSYARKTKIVPLDDIDLIYTIGIAHAVENNPYAGYEVQRCDCDLAAYSSEEIYHGNISSRKIVNTFRDALKVRYPASRVSRFGEVANVFLASYGVGFDIVPAFWISNRDCYLIPEGSSGHNWKETNPLKDQNILDGLDAHHGFQAKAAIRIVKWWFTKKKIITPRSYHLESVLLHELSCMRSANSLKEAVLMCFAALSHTKLLSSCPDPTGYSSPLTSGCTADDIMRIQLAAKSAYTELDSSEFDFVSELIPQ